MLLICMYVLRYVIKTIQIIKIEPDNDVNVKSLRLGCHQRYAGKCPKERFCTEYERFIWVLLLAQYRSRSDLERRSRSQNADRNGGSIISSYLYFEFLCILETAMM